MKLDKLHIFKRQAGSEGHSRAIPGSGKRIGSKCKHTAGTTGRNYQSFPSHQEKITAGEVPYRNALENSVFH